MPASSRPGPEIGLVACPDCSKQVSAQAAACPACGRPMKAIAVELTGKKWKLLSLISGVSFFLGVGSCGAAPLFGDGKAPKVAIALFAIGVVGTVGGFLGAVAAQVGAWWYHK